MSKEETTKPEPIEVIVKKIDLSFGQWIDLMVKVGLASIPAAIILIAIYILVMGVIAAILGS